MVFGVPPGAASSPAPDNGDRSRGRGRVLIPTIAVLVALVVILVLFSGFYTDLLWYRSIDADAVFTGQLAMRAGMFVIFGAIMALGVGVTMALAYRSRDLRPARTPEQQSLARYRSSLEPLRRPLGYAIPIIIGVLAGISLSAGWRAFAMWRNGSEFGETDPQFGLDVGFFVFTYPWLRLLLGFAFALVLIALLASIVVHYLYGGIRLQPKGDRISAAAQTQLSVLIGLLLLLKAAGYWLDRYGLALKSESLGQGFTGLKYRDIHALLPAKSILVVIALICAVLFFVNAVRPSWLVAGAGVGVMVVSALAIGVVYPAVVQQFQVQPSELTMEAASIQRNIDATRQAFGIDGIDIRDYDAKPMPNQQVLSTQAPTTEAIRIVDPTVVPPTFKALQQYRSFYSFQSALNVDRYDFDERVNGAVVAAREINLAGLQSSQRNWANDHMVFTHGYGFVAAQDNVKQPNGNPVFFESDIPMKGKLGVEQPRIYFGENSPDYSIVGGVPGTDPIELDYPDDSAPNGQRNNTYDGRGGVPVGSGINRLLFATKFQEPNILLSGMINEGSRIMWDRDPRTIVGKVAPWLRIDSDPYPVLVEGRIKWIVDAYTTTNDYPFSTRTTLSDAAGTSIAPGEGRLATPGTGFAPPRDEFNYIRNSAKAVVDAYDGTVSIYAWDETDPILRAWSQAFPGTVQPKAAMPESIVPHVRYPEDAFSVQRYMFARYHVTEAGAFYSGQDFWVVPTDPTQKDSGAYQSPYYLRLQMPGESSPAFSLTTTFAPAKRQTLAAFMRVDCTPGPDFGKFEVLQLPRNTIIPGPAQVQNIFESDTTIAQQLSLWRRGGSEVDLGNLLSLPVADGMLYVEPVYVRASQDGYPVLQKIMASFGEKVVMRDTLPEALRDVVGTGKPSAGGSNKAKPEPAQPDSNPLAELRAALADAQAAYEAGQQALRSGDFAAYGEAQKRLADALAKAEEARKRLEGSGGGEPASVAGEATPARLPSAAAIRLDWIHRRGVEQLGSSLGS